MTRTYSRWLSTELQVLSNVYSNKSKQEIQQLLPLHSWQSIMRQARLLNLPRFKLLYRKSNLSKLLEETTETYYWIGFLLADGSFTNRRLRLALCKKDLKHLKLFRQFIQSTNKISSLYNNSYFSIKLTSVDEIGKLKLKFKIHNDKTHHPFDISKIENNDLLFSLIIGFIDGDGTVSKVKNTKNCFTISCVGHQSAYENFVYMVNFLYQYFNFKKDGEHVYKRTCYTSLPQSKDIKSYYKQANFSINKIDLVYNITKKAVELKIPFMKRKFGKIVKHFNIK